jgi:RNA polymerase primary sigma factor
MEKNYMQLSLSDDESTVLYLNDIAASKPLSRQREVALAVRIKEGDMKARDELVWANLRFVIDVAKNYQHRGLPLLELISAGNLGLITAAERFDGTKGFKFISYAVWWIKQSILQTLAEQTRTVRLPQNRVALLRNIAKASGQLGREREADLEEIAAELDVPPAEVLETVRSARPVRSLDNPFDGDNERSLLTFLVDTSQKAPDAEVACASSRNQVAEILNSLDERERRIIQLYFGLEGHETLNLEQIGALMGVTRERIRQIKAKAFNKLRRPRLAQALQDLVQEV